MATPRPRHGASNPYPRALKSFIDGVDAWVSYEPIGLVLAVMPWNFPVWQVMRFAIPAITAGNGVLLKHSPNVTGCALALEQLFIDAGLPKGVVTTMVVA
jgi:succinate-semialdehyde dehydrogenase/glutarate-semialdehyde dehydrogenase